MLGDSVGYSVEAAAGSQVGLDVEVVGMVALKDSVEDSVGIAAGCAIGK